MPQPTIMLNYFFVHTGEAREAFKASRRVIHHCLPGNIDLFCIGYIAQRVFQFSAVPFQNISLLLSNLACKLRLRSCSLKMLKSLPNILFYQHESLWQLQSFFVEQLLPHFEDCCSEKN